MPNYLIHQSFCVVPGLVFIVLPPSLTPLPLPFFSLSPFTPPLCPTLSASFYFTHTLTLFLFIFFSPGPLHLTGEWKPEFQNLKYVHRHFNLAAIGISFQSNYNMFKTLSNVFSEINHLWKQRLYFIFLFCMYLRIYFLPFSEERDGICFHQVCWNFWSLQPLKNHSEQLHCDISSLCNIRCVPSGPMDFVMSCHLKRFKFCLPLPSHVCTEN